MTGLDLYLLRGEHKKKNLTYENVVVSCRKIQSTLSCLLPMFENYLKFKAN